MAIKNNLQDDQQEQKDQGQGLNTSGAQSTTSTASQGPAATGATAPTSSGYTNLDKYLSANQGSGAKMAGEATADLASQATDYTKTAANTAQQASNDYTNTANEAKSKSAGLQQGIANDANGNSKEAANFLGANYGAKPTTDYTSDLTAKAGKLNDNLNQVDDVNYQVGVNGQPGLLGQAYGKNGANYGSGFGALDSFLINGSQDGRDTLGAVKGRTNEVTGARDNATKTITDSDTAARQAFTGAQGELKGKAHDLFTQRDAGNDAEVARRNSLSVGRVGAKDFGAGDVTTDSDRLNLQALAGLSGDTYSADKYNQRGGTNGDEKVNIHYRNPNFTVSTAYQEPVADASTPVNSGPEGLAQNIGVNAAAGVRNPLGAARVVGGQIADAAKSPGVDPNAVGGDASDGWKKILNNGWN